MELIAEEILSVDATSITFSSIPATYKHLVIVVLGRSSEGGASALADVSMTLNGDTGANYDYQRLQASASTASASEGLGKAAILSAIQMAKSTSTAGVAGGAVIHIFDYARTSWQKACTILNAAKSGTLSGNLTTRTKSGFWRSTDAVTSVTLSNTNWVAGSVAALYGLP